MTRMYARTCRLALLGVILASPPVLGQPGPPGRLDSAAVQQRVQQLFIRGMTEVDLGDYSEAISLFGSALEHAPEKPALLQALADAHAENGDATTALFYARRAQSNASDKPYYSLRLAELQQKAGAPDAALATYRDLLDRFPNHEGALRGLARVQAELEQTREALQTYEVLVQHQRAPSARIERERLTLYEKIGDKQGATEVLESLIELRPYNDEYQRRLARLYAEQGEAEAALHLLQPLARAYPEAQDLQREIETLRVRSNSAGVRGEEEKGGRDARSTVALITDARSLYRRARSDSSNSGTDRLDRAERLVERALEKSPESVEAMTVLASIYEQKGMHAEAANVLTRALDQNPRSPQRWARAAQAYLAAGEYEVSGSTIDEGLLLFPGNRELLHAAARYAYRLARQGTKLDRAAQLARRAVRELDSNPTALHALGWIQFTRGHYDEARTMLDRALNTGPPTAQLLEDYGDLEHELGNDAAAHRYWERALERAPNRRSIREKLGGNAST